MIRQLLTIAIQRDTDVVVARRVAKNLAEIFGIARNDQTRLATAVSEIARNIVARDGTGQAEFVLDEQATPPLLLVRLVDRGSQSTSTNARAQPLASLSATQVDGLVAARRLVDYFHVDTQSDLGSVITVGKGCDPQARSVPQEAVARVLRELQADAPGDTRSALRDYDRELIASLQELEDKQQELQRLSDELQDTNRGVVALYAELDEKAEQLRAASEAKSRFLANVSHEFRTPLNSILALSRLLLDRVDGELQAEQEKQVGFIRRSAETLLEFVNDLLDLAKVEAGKTDLALREFSVADVFAGLRGVLKPLQTDKTVELLFEEPEAIVLFSDEGKVAQILRNFIANALKYTQRGEVRASATYDPVRSVVRFAVSDTGIGIAPQDQLRIFEEFEQVAGGFQQKHKGSGLGLALSRRLAKLLHGEIIVDSTLGAGSIFQLCVPLDHRHPTGLPAPDRIPGRKRVLVVDDEETFRYVVRQILESEPDFELIEATDGAQGLLRVRQDRPDVVVLDLQMPVLDGFGMLKELIADPDTRDIPVIISTSLPTNAELEQRLPGAAAMLTKSTLSKEILLGAIACALDSPANPQ